MKAIGFYNIIWLLGYTGKEDSNLISTVNKLMCHDKTIKSSLSKYCAIFCYIDMFYSSLPYNSVTAKLFIDPHLFDFFSKRESRYFFPTLNRRILSDTL
jgi:hypothetical protein